MDKIRKYPDPVLLKVAEKVTDMDEGREIARDLTEICQNIEWGNAAGMAAPQIGVSKRVFVTTFDTFINPEVVFLPKSGWRWFKEGCYSLDRERYDYLAHRPHSIWLKYTNFEGIECQEEFSGQRAQIISHEFDHLQGILCNSTEQSAIVS